MRIEPYENAIQEAKDRLDDQPDGFALLTLDDDVVLYSSGDASEVSEKQLTRLFMTMLAKRLTESEMVDLEDWR